MQLFRRLSCRWWLPLWLSLSLPLSAQQFVYDVDFVMDFDNLESHHTFEESGTLFGVRLSPAVGLAFGDSLVGAHRLMAGVSYVQPFGADWREARVHPTVYYRFAMRGWRLGFGFVPYSDMLRPLPDYLMSDRLCFTYPNVQGVLFDYASRRGDVFLLADWRGMMTDTVREAFRLVAGGRFCHRWFYTGGYAQLNHLSHSERVLGVVDEVLVNPLAGVDLGYLTPLDTLSLQVGYLCGYHRDRWAGDLRWAHGMHVDFSLRWRFLAARSELYFGGNQQPFAATYGNLVYQGDACYQSRLYSRTDLYLYMVRLPFVTAYAGWSLLYLDGQGLSHRQQVVCRFSLDGCMRYARMDKTTRRAEWRRGSLLRTLTYR